MDIKLSVNKSVEFVLSLYFFETLPVSLFQITGLFKFQVFFYLVSKAVISYVV